MFHYLSLEPLVFVVVPCWLGLGFQLLRVVCAHEELCTEVTPVHERVMSTAYESTFRMLLLSAICSFILTMFVCTRPVGKENKYKKKKKKKKRNKSATGFELSRLRLIHGSISGLAVVAILGSKHHSGF